MPQSIVQIVADGRPGGGTTAVLGLCQDLKAAGDWAVTLITHAGSYAAEQGRELGLSVIEEDFFRSRFDRSLATALRGYLADIAPRLVHAHGARAALPIAFQNRRKFQFVYTVHGYHFLQKSLPTKTLGRQAERLIARRADHVIFVSNADRAIARRERIYPATSTVIYNGIDLSDLTPVPPGEQSYDLVFSARMHPQKNPLFVLDILEALPEKPLQLLMIGGGELEPLARSEAERRALTHRVHFTGELRRADVLHLVRDCRLMLFPSLWEGLPIGPIEAMALGVPIIASDVDGTREVVTNGVTGVLIKSFDPAVYAEAIQVLLRDNSRRMAMAAAGRSDVVARFGRARSSSATASIYTELLCL